jgi:hypothetical protein
MPTQSNDLLTFAVTLCWTVCRNHQTSYPTHSSKKQKEKRSRSTIKQKVEKEYQQDAKRVEWIPLHYNFFMKHTEFRETMTHLVLKSANACFVGIDRRSNVSF